MCSLIFAWHYLYGCLSFAWFLTTDSLMVHDSELSSFLSFLFVICCYPGLWWNKETYRDTWNILRQAYSCPANCFVFLEDLITLLDELKGYVLLKFHGNVNVEFLCFSLSAQAYRRAWNCWHWKRLSSITTAMRWTWIEEIIRCILRTRESRFIFKAFCTKQFCFICRG